MTVAKMKAFIKKSFKLKPGDLYYKELEAIKRKNKKLRETLRGSK